MSRQALTGFYLGRRQYLPTISLMEQLFEARRHDEVGDLVLLLEHAPVITLGRAAHQEHILFSPERLAELGVEVVSTNRGGDVTLHAPGQLIAYPIIDLKPERCDVRKYVSQLSAAMNDVIRGHGLDGGTIKELIGLWIDGAQPDNYPGEGALRVPLKVGAIGVRISRWITSHGFALNLSTNMDLFRLIVPCGIQRHGVTSVQQLTGVVPSVKASAEQALVHLNARLGMDEPCWVDLSQEPNERLGEEISRYFSTVSAKL